MTINRNLVGNSDTVKLETTLCPPVTGLQSLTAVSEQWQWHRVCLCCQPDRACCGRWSTHLWADLTMAILQILGAICLRQSISFCFSPILSVELIWYLLLSKILHDLVQGHELLHPNFSPVSKWKEIPTWPLHLKTRLRQEELKPRLTLWRQTGIQQH